VRCVYDNATDLNPGSVTLTRTGAITGINDAHVWVIRLSTAFTTLGLEKAVRHTPRGVELEMASLQRQIKEMQKVIKGMKEEESEDEDPPTPPRRTTSVDRRSQK